MNARCTAKCPGQTAGDDTARCELPDGHQGPHQAPIRINWYDDTTVLRRDTDNLEEC